MFLLMVSAIFTAVTYKLAKNLSLFSQNAAVQSENKQQECG